MRIKVRLFAILRERACTSTIELSLPANSSASVGIEAILEQYPALRNYLPQSAIAINQTYASRETELHEGDELALIPPVSGG